MARLREAEQCIYLIEAPTGEVKIGIAENAYTRLQALRCSYPRGEARLVWVSEHRVDAWSIEAELHKQLTPNRLNGEWFDITADEAVMLASAVIPQGEIPTAKKQRHSYTEAQLRAMAEGGRRGAEIARRNRPAPRGRPAGQTPDFEERDRKLVAAYDAGTTRSGLCVMFKITRQRVSQILAAAGRRRRRSLSKKDRGELVAAFDAGSTRAELAATFKLAPSSVSRLLARSGRGRPKKRTLSAPGVGVAAVPQPSASR
jgi:hypothetical protein